MSGPCALITGVPTFEGPGESVADISDVLLNVDWVSKERRKVKHGAGESAGIPDHWNHRDCESESEGELQVSKIYVTYSLRQCLT
jgi:hypothetical protein